MSGYTLGVVDSGVSEGTASVTVPDISDEFWLVTRASESGAYWRFGRNSGGNYTLQKVANGQIASSDVMEHAAVVPAPGDRLACTYTGGVSCFVNGELVVSSSDSFNSDATMAGFAAGGAVVPEVTFDDFVVAEAAPASDLAVQISTGTEDVAAGDAVAWTATVTNTSAVAADGVEVALAVPAGLADLTVVATQGSCSVAAPGSTCDIGELAPSGSVTLEVTANAPAALGTYEVEASAAADGADADYSDNRATATFAVRSAAAPGEETTDSFDRADSATLGATDQGRPWENLHGSMGIVDGQAGSTAADGTTSMAVVDPGFTFGTLQVRVTEGAEEGFHLVFRARDGGDFYRVGPNAQGYYRVEKIRDGNPSPLQFSSVRENVEAADGDLLRLVLRPDDSWFLSVNGVHVLDGGDTDQMYEYRFGLATSSNQVRFDDLSISQVISSGITTVEEFDEADGTALQYTTATSGTRYPWLTPKGYWEVVDGRAEMQSPGYGLAQVEMSSQLADVSATVDPADKEAWVVFRMSHDRSYFRFGRPAGGTYTAQFVGADGSLRPIPGGVTVHESRVASPGDRLEVRQFLDGSVEMYVDDVLVASFVDDLDNVPESSYGIAGGTGVTFDDIEVVPK